MLIDSENLIARIDKCYQESAKTGLGLEPVMAIRDIKALISVMPEVDAVPIIRCKDCINWDTNWTTHPPDHYCPAIDQFTSADFYCGYSEKKDLEEQKCTFTDTEP